MCSTTAAPIFLQFKSIWPLGNYKPNPQQETGNFLLLSNFGLSIHGRRKCEYQCISMVAYRYSMPSGGKIQLTYEADDYAYVQDRKRWPWKNCGLRGNPFGHHNPKHSLFYNSNPLDLEDKTIRMSFFELPDNAVLRRPWWKLSRWFLLVLMTEQLLLYYTASWTLQWCRNAQALWVCKRLCRSIYCRCCLSRQRW